MIKAVFFDYHGVLDKRTFRQGMFGLIVKETYDPASGTTLKGHEENILQKYVPLSVDYASGKIPAEAFWSELKKTGLSQATLEHARNYILTVEPNKELWDALPSLKDKYYLGILSDCSKEKMDVIQRTFDLPQHFDAWHFSCDYRITKQDPEFFNLMTTGDKFLPEECLLVDDKEKVVDRAKSFGFGGFVFKSTKDLVNALE